MPSSLTVCSQSAVLIGCSVPSQLFLLWALSIHPSPSGVSRGKKGPFLPHYVWGGGGGLGAKEHEDYLITS